MNALDWIAFEAGAFYVMDRGYLDFGRLARIDSARAYFVIRAKSNTSFYVKESRPVDKSTGVRADWTIGLNGENAKGPYGSNLRRISYVDAQARKTLVFLTNNFDLEVAVVAKLYKARWQIELFFKWVKQSLRIKPFYGTSENAVKTQIWIAVCAYLMVAMASRVASGSILNKTTGLDENLSRILQVVSVNEFSKDCIHQLFMKNDIRNLEVDNSNQLMFNNF